VSDPLPAALAGAGFTWTCTPSAGSACSPTGTGDITDTVTVAAGGSVVYTLTGTTPADVSGDIVNSATVTPPPGAVDANCAAGCTASNTSHQAASALAVTGMQLAALAGNGVLLVLAGLLLLIPARRRRT
jgi:hypothetical protein